MRFDKCPACGYVIAPADWLACREPDAPKPIPPPPAAPEEPEAIVSAAPAAEPDKPEDTSEDQSNNGCDRGTVIGCLSLLFLLWLAWEAVSFLYNWLFR